MHLKRSVTHNTKLRRIAAISFNVRKCSNKVETKNKPNFSSLFFPSLRMHFWGPAQNYLKVSLLTDIFLQNFCPTKHKHEKMQKFVAFELRKIIHLFNRNLYLSNLHLLLSFWTRELPSYFNAILATWAELWSTNLHCSFESFMNDRKYFRNTFKLRCDERFTHSFNACGCVFKEITLVGSNQGNFFENAFACSKRMLKTTVATQL